MTLGYLYLHVSRSKKINKKNKNNYAVLVQYIFLLVPQFVKINPFFRTKVQIKIIICGNQSINMPQMLSIQHKTIILEYSLITRPF